MPHDLAAWAAGLFEGEGSFSASGSRGQVLYMELSMTDEDVVRRFYAAVGVGHVTKRKRHDDWPDYYKDQWRWSCGDRDQIRYLIDRFWPLLGQRRQDRFLELWYQTGLERRPERAGSIRRPTCNRGHTDRYMQASGKMVCRVCRQAAAAKRKGVTPDEQRV